jgi:predicted Zn-dependent peptidase
MKQFKLKNGLTVILAERVDAQTAAVLLLVKVGSSYETPPTYGGAHLVEHMVFKGTKKLTNTKKIAEYLDEVGGDYNAFTGKEMTGFHAVVEKAHLDRALTLMLELVDRPFLKEADFNSEKKVIIEEIKLHEDIPSHLAGDLFYQAMFPGQPVAHNIAGTRKSVDKFKYDAMRDFYDSHYRAEKMVLLVSADPAKLKDLDFQDYSAIQTGAKDLDTPSSEVDKTSARVELVSRKIEQANLILGFEGPKFDSPDRLILTLITAILGGMMSSRMFLEVREKQQLCYSIRSEIDYYQKFCIQTTDAGVKPENLNQALKAILAEYQKVKAEGISEAELVKGRDNLIGRLAISLDDSESLLQFYGRQWLFTGVLKSPQEMSKEIEAITQADILRVANKYFTPDTLSLSLVSPSHNPAEIDKILKSFK